MPYLAVFLEICGMQDSYRPRRLATKPDVAVCSGAAGVVLSRYEHLGPLALQQDAAGGLRRGRECCCRVWRESLSWLYAPLKACNAAHRGKQRWSVLQCTRLVHTYALGDAGAQMVRP